MLGAVEMCNNNGTCREFDAGVMCPSYRATRDEEHLTRGRANTLRLALTGQLGADAMASDAMAEAMALCVSCKACRRECPTGVDMAKMKIEVLAARAAGMASRCGTGWSRICRAMRRRRALAPLANLRNRCRCCAGWSDRSGLAAERALAGWRRDCFRDDEADAAPATARRGAAVGGHVQSLFRAGESARRAAGAGRRGLSRHRCRATRGRPLCCGRTYLAAGMVDRRAAEAGRTLRRMAGDLPVIGLEPSCLMTLRDEFRSLLPGAGGGRIGGAGDAASRIFGARETRRWRCSRWPAPRMSMATATRNLRRLSRTRWPC